MRKRTKTRPNDHLGAVVTEPLTRRQALIQFPPAVYAVRLADGIIKIGWSQRMMKRLERYGKGADLLAAFPSSLEHERVIHSRLREYRAHGREYYHPTPEVMAEVNQLRALSNLPAL